ncbi:MAG: glycosyltransferase [Propioniciclava sp.]|uniref:glycosyltransferase n=1 Tax=Propioniciclava sp. TaxID=2038686 RepID=UPI0039E5F0E5
MANTNLRVMHSFRRPRPTSNPYIHMLDEALVNTPGLDHLRFSWREAFFGRYDAIHFHWPEVFLGGRTRLRRVVKAARFQLLLWRLRITRTAIVRTVHNLELPTDLNGWETRMLRFIQQRPAMSITLNDQTQVAAPTALIPHGHYVDWFRDMPQNEAIPGRIGFVGLVRRYKGVESLLAAFEELRQQRDDVTLAISGRPTSDEIRQELESLAARAPGVSLRLEYLSEEDFAQAVTGSSLIVLPYVHMHNSGSALAALSLARPVLVPDNAVNRALREEVGEGWVHLFAGTLSAQDVDQALQSGIPGSLPDLSARGWSEAGTAHRDAYRRAVEATRTKR